MKWGFSGMPRPTPTFAEFWSLRHAAAGMPLTQLIAQRIGAVLAFLAGRAGLGPTGVTVLGMAIFLAAAILFATLPQGLSALLVCLLLLQLGYGFDCADGQLARATGRTSAFGAWLDIAADYFRNLVIAAAVVVWSAKSGEAPLGVAVGASFVFAIGIVIKLHTLTTIRQASSSATGGAGLLRMLALIGMDTVTLLALVALLRPFPVLLLAYLGAMGCLYGFIALRQAGTRLR